MKRFLTACTLWLLTASLALAQVPGTGAPGVPSSGGVAGAGGTSVQFNPNGFSFLGDSRVQYITVAAGNALTAQQWFNVANVRMGHRFTVGVNAGGSGCRSDQFLAQININAAIADPGQYVLINSPAANDIAAAPQNGTAFPVSVGASCSGNSGGVYPYTDANGNTVTAANVGQAVANNIVAAAEQLIAAGKTVVLTEEPGTTNVNTAALVGQVYDLNFRLRAYAAARPGRVLLFSYNSAVWNPTSSATAFGFKAGYQTDGVHYAPVGAYAQATAFINFWQGCSPVIVGGTVQCGGSPISDLSIANINFVNSSTVRSLSANPLFTTLTGGTNGGHCGTITGNIPSGWTLDCGAATTTMTITSAADAAGFGNDVTFAITTTAAEPNVLFNINAPAAGLYNLTDWLYGGMDISVASSSANASCYIQTANVSVESGSSQQYDMFPNAAGSFITTAYAFRLQTLAKQANAGSVTKSFLLPVEMVCALTAAGSVTVTVSRAFAAKAFIYNPATRGWSG